MGGGAERAGMDPRDLSDDDLDQLAQQLAGRLPTGTHGDNVILTRRQFALAASGVLSAGALTALGVDEASAQAAGQVGTSSDPVDAFAYTLDVQNGAEFNGTDISGVGSVSIEQLSLTPVHQETRVFSAGETQQGALAGARIDTSDSPILVTASPNEEPSGSALGFTVDSVRWSDFGQDIRARVSETEAETSGEALVTVYKLS